MITPFSKTLKIHHASKITLLSFTIIILAFIASMNSFNQLNQKTQQSYQQALMAKKQMSLINDMIYHATRRSDLMMNMLLTQDYFEVDQLQQRFIIHGNAFGKARKAFLAMPLSRQQRALLTKQWQKTSHNIPYQEQVVELILNDQNEQAKTILLTQALPNQKEIFKR